MGENLILCATKPRVVMTGLGAVTPLGTDMKTSWEALRRSDVMIAGGTEAAITLLILAGFCQAKAVSMRNSAPGKAITIIRANKKVAVNKQQPSPRCRIIQISLSP